MNLSKAAGAAGGSLHHLNVGLGWDAKASETSGAEFDLDASCFILGSNGKVLSDDHFIFYNNVDSPEGAVHHSGDNLTGAGEGDDEVIQVDISKMPSEAAKIAFTVTINEANERHQNFGLVDNAFIRAVDPDTGAELVRYELDMEASLETAVVFGEIVRHGNDWIFSANSAGFPAGLAGLCRQYGVNV